MNALSRLREKLAHSKKYRESFAASVVKRMIPLQIRVLRKQREWSQAELAKQSSLTQGVISRAEDPEYGNLTVNTLVRVAAGFDCAYIGRFVPFSELGKWYSSLDDEKLLEVSSFESDTGFIERKDAAISRHYEGTVHRLSLSPTVLDAELGRVVNGGPPIRDLASQELPYITGSVAPAEPFLRDRKLLGWALPKASTSDQGPAPQSIRRTHRPEGRRYARRSATKLRA
jgi:transcriptional regulator with XRE-family HTH domain